MKKVVIGIIIGAIVFGSVGVYATVKYAAEQISYKNTTVEGAIDDLYRKIDKDNFANNIECESGKICIASQVHVGDYVKMLPTLTKYTILSSETGYPSNQTINPSELNIWRVISINSDGTVDAVSEYVSSINVYFQGKIGYKNYVGTLNKIAAAYTNSNYVEGTRHMGYGAVTQYITDTTKLDKTTAPWTVSTSNTTTFADEKQGIGDIGYEADYNLVTNIVGQAFANKVQTTDKIEYWLASRRYSYGGSSSWYFRARYVENSGNANFISLYGYNSNGFSSSSAAKAIRPIITLKAGLTTSAGDGKSESTAWILD